MHPGWIVLLSMPGFGSLFALVALVRNAYRDTAAAALLRAEVVALREDVGRLHDRLDVIDVVIRARHGGPPASDTGRLRASEP